MDARDNGKWQKIETNLTALLSEVVKLMEDMIASTKVNYLHSRKLYSFRPLCFGYLIIGKDNVRAVLRLMKADLVHQTNYINRNMFEMVVTLFYIDTGNDKQRLNDLTDRYFDYATMIIPYKAMLTMAEYLRVFEGMIDERLNVEIQIGYNDFLKKYHIPDKNNQKVLETWSGKSIYKMLSEIEDIPLRDMFLEEYLTVTQMNNQFLHPTGVFLANAIQEEVGLKVDSKVRVTHLTSTYNAARRLMWEYLRHFNKNRSHFRERLNDIDRKWGLEGKSLRDEIVIK